MQLDRPLRTVTPTVDGDVLAVLGRADADFTPSAVKDLIGEHSVEGVRNALNRLAGQGIVEQRRAGAAYLYRLNRNHLAAVPLIALAGLCDTLLSQVCARIARWSVPCAYAALFGSAARGGMRADSDIDIFVVRPLDVAADDDVWQEQLRELGHDIVTWTGNDTQVLEYSASEVEQGFRDNDSVLLDIQAAGIRLGGPAEYLGREWRRRP